VKKIFILFFVIFFPLSGFAEQIKVFVSVLPQKYFVEKIGKDTVLAEVMVLPGHSPASYNPKPQQMKRLSDADIYFSINVPFEKTWLPKIRENYKNLYVSDCTQKILKRKTDENFFEDNGHDHDHDGHDHGFYDPHVWMSPLNVLKISRNIMMVLSQKNPSKKDFYLENYLSFSKEILELDLNLLKSTQNIKNKNVFVFHPSWGYFMDDYNLKQIPVESQGKEPGPKYLAKLMEFAKKNNIKTLLVQPQFPLSTAKVMEKTLGLNVVTADPLAEDWKNNLIKTAEIIVEKN
jgi:zinc transport system substrate-binding protein